MAFGLMKRIMFYSLVWKIFLTIIGGAIILYLGFRFAPTDKGLSTGIGLFMLLISVPLILITLLLRNLLLRNTFKK